MNKTGQDCVKSAHEYTTHTPKVKGCPIGSWIRIHSLRHQAFVKGSVLSVCNNIKRRHIWSTRGFAPCRELTEPPLLWACMSCASDSWRDRTQLCADQHVSVIHRQVFWTCNCYFSSMIYLYWISALLYKGWDRNSHIQLNSALWKWRVSCHIHCQITWGKIHSWTHRDEKTRIVTLDGMDEIPIAMIEIKHPSRSDTLDVFKQARFYTINLLFFLACCFSALVFMV